MKHLISFYPPGVPPGSAAGASCPTAVRRIYCSRIRYFCIGQNRKTDLHGFHCVTVMRFRSPDRNLRKKPSNARPVPDYCRSVQGHSQFLEKYSGSNLLCRSEQGFPQFLEKYSGSNLLCRSEQGFSQFLEKFSSCSPSFLSRTMPTDHGLMKSSRGFPLRSFMRFISVVPVIFMTSISRFTIQRMCS